VLKILAGLKSFKSSIDWSKFYLYYVNHKCVPDTDALSTHFKAKGLFIDDLKIAQNNIKSINNDLINTTGDVASDYQRQISALVPLNDQNVPVFDYMLLGMG
jgi:6-phosphogluconolactonase